MPKGFEITVSLPMFSPSNTAQTAANILTDTLGSTGGQNITFLMLLMNYAVGLSANLVFGGINALQIVGTLAIFSIIVPPNSMKIV